LDYHKYEAFSNYGETKKKGFSHFLVFRRRKQSLQSQQGLFFATAVTATAGCSAVLVEKYI
jgi:hypothetical protein